MNETNLREIFGEERSVGFDQVAMLAQMRAGQPWVDNRRELPAALKSLYATCSVMTASGATSPSASLRIFCRRPNSCPGWRAAGSTP